MKQIGFTYNLLGTTHFCSKSAPEGLKRSYLTVAGVLSYIGQSKVEMSHPTVSKTDAQGVFAPAATNESEVASLTPNHGHNARDLPPERPRYLPLGHSPPKLVIHPYSGLESETTRTHDSLDLSSDEADTCMPDRLDRDESEDDVRSSTLSQLSRTSLHLETGPKYKVFGTTTGVSLNRRVGNASSDVSQPWIVGIFTTLHSS